MCCRLQKQRQQTANGEQQTVNRVYRQVNTTRNLCAMRINSADTRKTRYEKLKSRWKRKSTFLATSRWTCFGSVAFDYSNAAPETITCSSFALQIRLALIFWQTSSQCDCSWTARQTDLLTTDIGKNCKHFFVDICDMESILTWPSNLLMRIQAAGSRLQCTSEKGKVFSVLTNDKLICIHCGQCDL